jgi:hypothetical protein
VLDYFGLPAILKDLAALEFELVFQFEANGFNRALVRQLKMKFIFFAHKIA